MRFFFLFISLLLTAIPVTTQANEVVEFQRFSQGIAATMVRKRLLEENEDYANILGRAPSHAIAYHDLNGDNTPEMIVRIDDEYNFCEIGTGWCDTRIYVYQGTQLIEVGQFVSNGRIRISNNTTENIRQLLVERKDGRFDLFIWQKNKYVKVTRE